MLNMAEKSSDEHNNLIRGLVKALEERGFKVQADHISHPNGQPNAIDGHIPDIDAVHPTGTRILGEAEIRATMASEETRLQLLAFSRRKAELHVVVPHGLIPYMQQQVKVWGIHIDKWWESTL